MLESKADKARRLESERLMREEEDRLYIEHIGKLEQREYEFKLQREEMEKQK